MSNKEFSALARSLSPALPSFAIKGPLLLICPMNGILRGLLFESHSHSSTLFYVWVFFLPLCVPTRNLALNLGRRISSPGGGPWDSAQKGLIETLIEAVKREGLPFLSRVESIGDLADSAGSLPSKGPYTLQAIAYSLARDGKFARAVTALDEMMQSLDGKIAWQLEMAKRANALKSKLLSDPAGALRQLQDWEAESLGNLGLAGVC